jgi:DNA polymerase-3 subunit alpha
MRRLLTEMQPDRLEDLIAANALYRPGPMDLIPDYNARKNGEQQVPASHPIVEKFTRDTYGIMVYQEQVMQIVHELGGIPLRQAYTLIKAISKKKEKVINANRAAFIAGAGERGLDESKADELFELILKFAGYGFNKSHSTGYAIVAYQTALLKTYFPNQYMAAFLTYESQAQKVEDWIKYKDDCRRTRFLNGKVGVEIMPPDINVSDEDFTVVFDEDEPRDAVHGHVRFGLRALKGAGDKAIRAIVAERKANGPFTSLYDFAERVPPGMVNKATIEALICCGAFDSVHGQSSRASMVASINDAVSAGQSVARDRAAGQGGLFGAEDAPAAEAALEPSLVRAPAWDDLETLAKEKEVLGFYVSSHPLDQWSREIATFATASTDEAAAMRQDACAIVGALIKQVRPVVTRKGDRMAIMTIEDAGGSMDAVLFPRTYAEQSQNLMKDAVAFIAGKVDLQRGDPQLIVERVIPAERAAQQLASGVEITIDAVRENGSLDSLLHQLRGVLSRPAFGPVGGGEAASPAPVSLRIRTRLSPSAGSTEARPTHMVTLKPRGLLLAPTPAAIEEIEHVVGRGAVAITGGLPGWLSERSEHRRRRAGA